jgi:hypothetical protein
MKILTLDVADYQQGQKDCRKLSNIIPTHYGSYPKRPVTNVKPHLFAPQPEYTNQISLHIPITQPCTSTATSW